MEQILALDIGAFSLKAGEFVIIHRFDGAVEMYDPKGHKFSARPILVAALKEWSVKITNLQKRNSRQVFAFVKAILLKDQK